MSDLLQKIKEKKSVISVIGLGYVGLPLAVEFAKVGFPVYGIDRIKQKVELLIKGKSYIIDVDEKDVKNVVGEKFFPTTDYSVINKSDCVLIAVPTPLQKSKDPDVSYITAAMDEVVKYLHKDMLIVLESTTYPGTTRELIAERISKYGYKIGKDFFVAFSPERVDPGNPKYNTKNTPKVVGGITGKDTLITRMLYEQVIEKIVTVDSPEEAEMVKLLENTFRAVNIGLVNELAIMCHRMGIDIWNVIEAASSKPFGFMPFYPGPGIGGHCIPLDPMYLSWKAKMYDYYNRFIELASDVNSNMPRFVLNKVSEILNKYKKTLNGSKVLLMGITYKKDIDDLRESPALEVYHLLKEMGALITVYDPMVNSFIDEKGEHRKVKVKKNISGNEVKKFDCVILLTNHSSFDYRMIAKNAKIIFDTRNGFKEIKSKKIIKL
ncbi:MAG: Nucleotide sugar dehydrogenase [candidate division TA06 bacterium 32_111]|uniref:Nucleotide sugar dehydrogenase n=2 Tax=Bacteria candidate phyla TaxID=1783234 RepID=A0A101I3E0_UNCT6|nr:MAG: Nucleotide sugar dehydrogenase [candidate division TA06 bacterium 32_111]KUK87493.1 MAG: Nucleotide sugar dehydrogenase [candidate division TA06 bacterium 34_109]HAF08170.1 UDP-N-acetyl-D-glucosamine dehydrogenase [candidate division WOR-3 bacterium]HCP16732.1 UDP-N-acetyl-D-glucosamine dehydrogenase [candidate division WOR-3 bacterium]